MMFFFINLSSIICIARQHTLLLSSPRQLKTTLKVSQRKEALMLCMCIYIYTIPHIYSCQVRTVMEREREREKTSFCPGKDLYQRQRARRGPLLATICRSLSPSLCVANPSHTLFFLYLQEIYTLKEEERGETEGISIQRVSKIEGTGDRRVRREMWGWWVAFADFFSKVVFSWV